MKTDSAYQGAVLLAADQLRTGYELVALHCYRDADGVPICWRIRCTHPDKPKWMRPMYHDGARYVLGEPPAPPLGKSPYRLPELLAANPDTPVWIVEGEACADVLAFVGLVATTSGGAASAASTDWTPLRGRQVRLWPDHDEAGARYADAVAERLALIGCKVERVDAARLEVPPKGDCIDWLHSHPDATSADIEALPRAPLMTSGVDEPRVILTRASDVEPKPVEWLWHGWLAAGKLHLLGGAPGTGKTTIAIALAATITRGSQWPDGSIAPAGDVVLWSGEDDLADTLGPRLRAAGADTQRVHVVGGVVERGTRYPFDPAHDMDGLRSALRAVPDLRLIIVDPLVSMIAGDSHKNAEVRRGLQPLVDLGADLGCAIVGVTHFSKGTSGRDPVERITGSVAFGALARLVMVTVQQDVVGEQPARLFVRAKTNLGPNGGGFAYSLEQVDVDGYPGLEASKAIWGEPVEGSARDLLATTESDAGERSASDDAMEWLLAVLEAGPVPAKRVVALARQSGISDKVLRIARERLRVETKRIGFGANSRWDWSLPSVHAQGTHRCPAEKRASMDAEGTYGDAIDNGGL